ncbi:MAG: methyltransferase domain-containing protein [Undibacterium sp.]|nr:methyltransferase domain-containing protein [Undibacterium sp.]
MINSNHYWNQRFATDWSACQGPQQSRFFSRIAIANLPAWFCTELRRQALSLADWGCAQGDGCDVWSAYIDPQQITGIDFSDVAISHAKQNYPKLSFLEENWLQPTQHEHRQFDVVFSSNTLEHFHQPHTVLAAISARANKAVVLALPYRELERGEEHFYSFIPENIPAQLDNGMSLIWSKVVDCKSIEASLWQGEQIILVYAHPSWIQDLKLNLDGCHIEHEDSQHLRQAQNELSQLQNKYVELDARLIEGTRNQQMREATFASQTQDYSRAIDECEQHIVLMEQSFSEHHQMLIARDLQVENLHEMLFERDQEIALRIAQAANYQQQQIDYERSIKEYQQALTQHDLQHEKNLQQARAQHEENAQKIAQLNLALHGKMAEITQLKKSASWLLTRPMRFAQQFISSPKRASYDLAKFVFWRLPPTTRQALHTPRHRFVRWARSLPAPVKSPTNYDSANGDLSWVDFQQQVLAKRDQYKGIFVQEVVIDWNVPLYQRPQHIAVAFGRLGYLVIYKTVNWSGDDVNGFRQVAPNVWVSNRHEVDQIEGAARSLYSTGANLPESLMNNSKHGSLVYEYIDHIDPQISGDPENVRRLVALKDYAFNHADFVVASANKLAEEAIAAVGKDKVILVQNGVDTKHYRNDIHDSTPLPERLQIFRQCYPKTVGYFGALAPWLWYEAIAELVASRPDLGFIFIGPDYYGGADKLPQADNVLYLGSVNYQILPAYARQFDVCFIPFAPGEIARTTSPLKLFEYFALEKPVVVTSDMAECVAFEEVFSGDSSTALSAAIDAAFAVKDQSKFTHRLAQLADQNDWNCRAKAMEKIFN